MHPIRAIYEKGRLRLSRKLPFRNNTRVRLTFEWPIPTRRAQHARRRAAQPIRVIVEPLE